MTTQFQVGKTYACRSACDYDCMFRFEVVARTAKTLTFKYCGDIKRRGIFVWDGIEQCKPCGTYSMCPIISADRE